MGRVEDADVKGNRRFEGFDRQAAGIVFAASISPTMETPIPSAAMIRMPAATPVRPCAGRRWRCGPESNRHAWICNPLPNHSATAPQLTARGIGWVRRRVKAPLAGIRARDAGTNYSLVVWLEFSWVIQPHANIMPLKLG